MRKNKIKLIYIGNKLSIHGNTPTSIEILGRRLADIFDVVSVSNKKNQLLRLMEMWHAIFVNRKADFLLIDTYSTSAFIFAWTSARIAKLLGIRYIPILHGGDLPKRIYKSPKKLSKFLSKAHEVVCPSAYLKFSMEKLVSRPYCIIPNFIEIDLYPFTSRQILPDDDFKILWVRAFHEIYNPELAVRVLHHLVNSGFMSTQLCMVGPDKDGSMKNVIALANELGVLEKLTITGKLTKIEWIKLSEKYNIFLNTTNIDNAPISIVEAMALGFPIVTTNVGGLSSLLENNETAILVPPNDETSIANAIVSIKSRGISDSLSQNARLFAEQQDWKVVFQKWQEILQ